MSSGVAPDYAPILTLEGALSKLCLGGAFDVQRSQNEIQAAPVCARPLTLSG